LLALPSADRPLGSCTGRGSGLEEVSLISCKDCEKKFSTDAKSCPHCGANKPNSGWAFIIIVIVAVSFSISLYSFVSNITPRGTNFSTEPNKANIIPSYPIQDINSLNLKPIISCKDIESNNPNYSDNMKKFASLAKFAVYEHIISNLCEGTNEAIDNIGLWVDYGYASANEVEDMARILGKNYKAPKRTTNGLIFEKVRKKYYI